MTLFLDPWAWRVGKMKWFLRTRNSIRLLIGMVVYYSYVQKVVMEDSKESFF
jgi:hypothetical protein